MIEKYRPSNGSAGMFFLIHHCARCLKEDKCDINYRTMIYDLDDEEYPDEWRICPAKRKPVCTAFEEKKMDK